MSSTCRHAMTTVLIALVACADPSAIGPADDGTPDVGVPEVVEITCLTDGSINLSSGRVLALPDGVHLTLQNRVDEPTSLNGLGMDLGANERRNVISGVAPGVLDLACWPFSEHGSGEEPATTPLEVLDPEGLYVPGEVECDGSMSSMIADFAHAPDDDGPPPLVDARSVIEGLRATDTVTYSGYPERPGSVIVIRDGEVVASYGMVRFGEEGSWTVAGSTICGSSGLR